MIFPKFVEVGVRFGSEENTGVLVALNASSRNWQFIPSRMRVVLMIDASYVVAQRSRRLPQRAGVVCSEFGGRTAKTGCSPGSTLRTIPVVSMYPVLNSRSQVGSSRCGSPSTHTLLGIPI